MSNQQPSADATCIAAAIDRLTAAIRDAMVGTQEGSITSSLDCIERQIETIAENLDR